MLLYNFRYTYISFTDNPVFCPLPAEGPFSFQLENVMLVITKNVFFLKNISQAY